MIIHSNIQLINYTGKELHYYKSDDFVIDIPKENNNINIKKEKYDDFKIEQFNTQFGSFNAFNEFPFVPLVNILPFEKKNVYYIVDSKIVIALKRFDLLYTDDIIKEDQFHIYFKSFKLFHY